MSCSRVSVFFAATAIRRNADSMSAPRSASRSRPWRHWCVDLGQVGVAAPVARVDQRQPGPVRARLGAEDPRRGRTASRRAPRCRPARAPAGSSARPARATPRPRQAASSSSATTCGNASRKNPEMRTVTSIRGRPSSDSSTTEKPVTRRDASSQFGRQPISASTSAMSSPWCASPTCPTVSPTGPWVGAGVRAMPLQQRVGQCRADLAEVDGIAFGSTVEVPPGGQHVHQPAGG